MAFSLFRKKKEVIDFTSTNSEGIPTEGYMKRKGINAPAPSSASSNAANPSSSSSGSGFFGSFFGGGSSDSSSSAQTAPAPAAQTDFWGNPVNTNTSAPAISSANNDLSSQNSQISDILYRLSRLTDRLELIERKMDRLERKTGISGSE